MAKEIKLVKCQGTGKANGYGCGEKIPAVMYNQTNRVYGLGKSCKCYQKWLLNSVDGMELVEKRTLKSTQVKREFKEAKKEHIEQKSLPALLINVRNAVHKYIRERDKGLPCISCGVPHRNDFQAGHCYSANSFSTLKFNYFNINSQCMGCNLTKSGNETEYRFRLPKRIGLREYETLITMAENDKSVNFKWDREELYRIRDEANKLYRELKK